MSDTLERLRDALADRYAVESEIGRGGMATVFLAEDLRHHRKVAIKVLHPELALAVGSERFLREIEIAAGLHHPHILPVFDSGEADGLLYYVMPYSEGESLRQRLERDGKLPADEAVRLTHEVADALAYAHRQGLVHRDIKPGNILVVEGHAVVTDFGVALAMAAAEASRVTATGLAVGTPTYMSPEQASGQADIDGRSDVYSLGCVLFEMVIGDAPFAGSTPQQILASKLTEPAVLPEAPEGTLLQRVRGVLRDALARQPEDRLTSAELSEALQSAMAPVPVAFARWLTGRSGRWALAAAALFLVAGGIWGWQANRRRQAVQWAHRTGLPELQQLVDAQDWEGSYRLAMRIERIIPGDTILQSLWPQFSAIDSVRTDPPGALVYRRSYGTAADTSWHLLGQTPLDQVRLPFGFSRLRIELEGYEPRLFVPTYPDLWAVHVLDPEGTAPEGMVRVDGFSVPEGLWGAPDSFSVNDYYLDRYEVTNREYKRFVDEGGYARQEFWTEPFVSEERTIPWAEGMELLVDRTGRPGPSTWELSVYPDGQDDYPVNGISWFEATAYARFVGKSVPTMWHLNAGMPDTLLNAATELSNFGRAGGPAPAGAHDGLGAHGTYDQYGNVDEWTYNPTSLGHRIMFGGSWSDASGSAAGWDDSSPWYRTAANGFRLALYRDTAGLAVARAPRDSSTPTRDYLAETPVDDDEFRSFLQLYEYDQGSLDAVLESSDTTTHWIVERVGFTAAYGFERMAAYIYLPRGTRPPYQAIVCWPGTIAMFPDRFPVQEAGEAFDFFMKTGRAFVFPLFKGTFDRDDPDNPIKGHPEFGSYRQRDLRIMWIKDLRRTLDYLETREDVDRERIAYYGWSWGGFMMAIALAVEPRFKVGIGDEAGFTHERPLAEVDPFHYLPRVRAPVLMLSGERGRKYWGESKLAFFGLLGTPDEDKRHVWFPAGHNLDNAMIAPHMLDWLDEYLGPVEGYQNR